MLKLVGRMVLILVIVGVVLGAWRYLGQGVGISSPDWFNNAFDSVQDWLTSLGGLIEKKTQ